MQPSSSLPNDRQCQVCQRALLPGALFCSACGARAEETPAETLRGVNYLLKELERWETAGVITREQAATLRERYEYHRSNLRAQLAPSNGEHPAQDQPHKTVTETVFENISQTPPPASTHARAASAEADRASAQADAASSRYYHSAQTSSRSRSTGPEIQPPGGAQALREPRTLLETLTDPHNLRLLLYTGAAMIVVSVVLWLRDVLYLKLQEPVVQAGLLAIATLAFMVSGWYAILRTRQRLTGRALTLVGSLLVPINFWFLVRSGLIENNGRAWIVCAFCAILYAHTAALLREKLYVYLAAAGSVATAWALVFRAEREAFGLYALTLMLASLIFLHLSRLFPLGTEAGQGATDDERPAMEHEGRAVAEDERGARADAAPGVHRPSAINGPLFKTGRWSYELWSVPLIRVGLICAALSALLYMPLRLGPTLFLSDGLFHLGTNRYDASIAILLFAAWAYALWFTGRFIYTDRRVPTFTLCVLAFCWALILALDGLRVTDSTNLLTLSLAALAIALAHRIARDEDNSRALYYAGVIFSVLLIPLAPSVIFNAGSLTLKHSASGVFLAASFALLSAPRFNRKFGQSVLAFLSALFASTAFMSVLASAHLRAETIYLACAAWPFALYLGARLLRLRSIETQLAGPFALTADVLFILMLVWSGILAALMNLDQEHIASWRVPLWCVLLAASLYGALRAVRESSIFGAGFASLALLVLVATFSDSLQQSGVLPFNLPVAGLVICAAFLLPKACALWLPSRPDTTNGKDFSQETIVRLVSDLSVMLCGLWWFARAVDSLERGGFGAACVLLLVLLYWSERAARGRQAWIADIAFISAGAFLFALLVALRLETRWFAFAFALVLPNTFFALGQAARARGLSWLEHHAHGAAWVAATLCFVAALLQTSTHLRTGEALLLAPCLTTGALAVQAFAASLLITGPARVKYFRAGLLAAIISFSLACLRAGYDPGADLEIYTSPVAVALLLLAYLSLRREWEEYERDTNAMLWLGSLMLCAPLLFHALEFRLVWDVAAQWRDLGVLCAALALILLGVLGRLRAPVSIGIVTLLTELLVLTLTSVQWTQVPLKVYLGTVGSLLMIAGWMLGFRREQLINMRARLQEQREHMQERFGEWR
jgi:hypothetical protein